MEGDRHHIGSLCARHLLEERGWEVYFLGADVPVEDFAAIQRSRNAGLVCVSFAPPNTAADMKRCVRILGEFYERAHPYTLVLGGDLSETPFLDDLELPFLDIGTFGSMAAFDSALVDGFGLRPGETERVLDEEGAA
jgi:methanogenic corrinoid protein MtbC1